MFMAIKKINKPVANVSEAPKDTSSRVNIFIWENKYKETNKK